MSDEAKTLMHYISNWRKGCADDSDREHCAKCAFAWAAHIIAGAA